jgi:hypothetical protein
MTGRQPLPENDPMREVAEEWVRRTVETWRCPHCDGRARSVWLGGRFPLGVEYHHETGCPEHDENL